MMTPMVLRLGEMLGVGGLGFDAICTPPFAKSFVDVEPGGGGGDFLRKVLSMLSQGGKGDLRMDMIILPETAPPCQHNRSETSQIYISLL